MTEAFSGILELTEDEELDVTVEVGDGHLRLLSSTMELGAWPLLDCRVLPTVDGSFWLTVEGEWMTFTPDDPNSFDRVVTEHMTGRKAVVEDTSSTFAYRDQTGPVDVVVEPAATARGNGDGESGLGVLEPISTPETGHYDEPAASFDEPEGFGSVIDQATATDEPLSDVAGDLAALEAALAEIDRRRGVEGGTELLPDPRADAATLDATDVAAPTWEQPAEALVEEPVHTWPDEPDWPDQPDVPATAAASEAPASPQTEVAAIEPLAAAEPEVMGRWDEPHDLDGDGKITVADEVLATQRKVRRTATKKRIDLTSPRVWAAAGAAVVLIGTIAIAIAMSGDDAANPVAPPVQTVLDPGEQGQAAFQGTVTSVATAPTSIVGVTTPGGNGTTVPVESTSTTTLAPEDTLASIPLFDLTPAGFVDRWNSVAAEFRAQQLPAQFGVLEQSVRFSSRLSLAVTLASDGTIGSVRVLGDPRGGSDSDREILTALGLAISTADPTLDGPGRADLLAILGLDVSRPDLAGLDGTFTRAGVTYRMLYRPDEVLIDLLLVPEGTPIQPTTSTSAAG